MNSDEHPRAQLDPKPDILVCKDREREVTFVTNENQQDYGNRTHSHDRVKENSTLRLCKDRELTGHLFLTKIHGNHHLDCSVFTFAVST